MNSVIIYARAFLAYCEGKEQSSFPFALIPYQDAIETGIPFSETFVYEGREWAIFISGDFMPDELEQLETLGIVDPYDPDDERQDATKA